jgi:hypothetical protein
VKDIFFWWHFGLAEAITIGGVKPSRSRQQDILEERMHDLVIGLFINRYEFGQLL